MRNSRLFVALAAVLVVALGALLFLPAAVRGPEREATFARGMIDHHLQAVDMSLRLRDRTQDPTLRALTTDILLGQQEQVGQMRGWMSVWGVPWTGPGVSDEHRRAMGMATQEEVRALSTLPVAEAEAEFLRLMLRHHQGAVAMIDPLLEGRARPEVRALALQMQRAQTAEIELMESLLEQRGAQPLAAPEDHGEHVDH